ncbi:glycosyl hydrolase [Hymenobacter defluvii]|uniref:Discoidin domain-containing protein n=1 Tax=Hymenobacter defluvii TaxID=2054411 RepID=A0ABS3TF66_9BACT|nr:glycosyl hydrolase [Hymenobacter defluvii]MBO3272299.1 discoidin domain-containing protein [Hymenobacter defluvii]
MKTLYSLALVGALLAGSTAAVAQTAYKSLNFLYSISGTRTASGMHNRQPIATPSTYTNRVQAITGQYPALWSSDFLFEQSEINNRWAMTNEAKAQWAQGALVNLMFHACPPTQAEPCQWEGGIKSSLTNAQWQELITDGTQLNRNWKARLDAIVPYLQDLKNNGVEVLFRPLHEMNQGVFWWAGRPGPNGTARLYQITHDYLRNTKGLTNLIWVWNVQDFGSLASDLANYNPGSSYWDVLSLDMYYTDGQGYTTAKYNAMLNAAGGKPIAIGECEVLPSPSLLASQPKWSFFMGWSELVFEKNSTTTIQNAFWASNVLVRDEMPGWGSGGSTPTAPNIAYRRPVSVSSSENSTNTGDKAVDADGNTRWASSYANNQYLYVDLGATYSINRVRLAWEAAYAKDYQVQVSTDNVTWTTIKDVWGKSAAAPDDHTGLNARGRYMKVYCINRATQYGFSLYELEVYGTSVVTSARTAAMPVQEGRAASSLAIYPNPTSGMLQVQLPAAQQPGKVVLRNVQGQEVLRKTTNGPTFALDLSHLPAGIYWLTVAGAASQTAQKVVKL